MPTPQATFKAEVAKANMPPAAVNKAVPPAPSIEAYTPIIKGFSKLFKSRTKEKLKEAEDKFHVALGEWEKNSTEIRHIMTR